MTLVTQIRVKLLKRSPVFFSGGKSVAFWRHGDQQQYKWCKFCYNHVTQFAKFQPRTKSRVKECDITVINSNSLQSTRCTTSVLPTEGSPHPTCRGSLSRPSHSPTPVFSPSASSTHTPRVASSRRTPTCPRASSISPPPFASQTERSRRRTRAHAPCSFETRSNRWSWTASRSERRQTGQCLTPTTFTLPGPVGRPGNRARRVIVVFCFSGIS